MFFVGRLIEQPDLLAFAALVGRFLMVAPTVEGIDLFKIAGRSISRWVPSFKMGTVAPIKQPFCSQLEERLLLWLEYHPQVKSYARGDIGQEFAMTYRLPTPKHAPFAIGYAFEGKPHDYLPDVVGTLTSGKLFIAEAGMEDDKGSDRNLAKAEAARRLARLQRGVFWIGTEQTLTRAQLPLVLLPPDAPPLVPNPLPDTLLPEPEVVPPAVLPPEVLCVRRVP